MVRLDAGQVGALPGPESEPDQDSDADEVVDDGRPGDRDEAPAGVQQRGAECEEAVGADLDHEPAQERRGDLALEDEVLELRVAGMGIGDGQSGDEVGRGDERDHRRSEQHDHRHRDDRRDGVEGVALVLVGQPVDEDRDEGGREGRRRGRCRRACSGWCWPGCRSRPAKSGRAPRPGRPAGADPVMRETPVPAAT